MSFVRTEHARLHFLFQPVCRLQQRVGVLREQGIKEAEILRMTEAAMLRLTEPLGPVQETELTRYFRKKKV